MRPRLAATVPAVIGLLSAFCLLMCAGCEYEVPLTAAATRPTQESLVGTWHEVGGKDVMFVRQLDAATYVLTYNGDLYSAQHSDLDAMPFVSVLHLDPTNRKYSYLTWTHQTDPRKLTLHVLSSKVIPASIQDRSALQKLIREHRANPALFASEHHYVREK
ncbi:hypothetical protein [Horticoccus sp. 23ND18S-11]|uniref:hypothetical protein n=1 Tax=Horticoccus sp. 23ND18S-11 TaxID=3391832 RepID=UPI0039C9C86F